MAPPLTPALLSPLAAFATAHLAGEPAPLPDLPAEIRDQRLVHLTLRRKGSLQMAFWAQGAGLADALAHGLAQARAALAAGRRSPPDMLLLDIAGAPEPLDPDDLRRGRCNAFRGIFGLELHAAGRLARIAPSLMIARNLTPARALELLQADLSQPPEAPVEALRLPAVQILLELPQGRARPLMRGQPVVPQTAITRTRVAEMATLMTGWMQRGVSPSGRATYKYWPSSGQYALSNNMIRQFMGSACLARAAARPEAPQGLAEARDRNFAHNFHHWYRDEGAFGVIVEGPKVKLGAAAVALGAILDLPAPAAYATELRGLAAFLKAMQHPEGRFTCFLRPPGREDDCQNFYPGEALLALMRLYRHTGDPALLDQVARGFAHYRDWHRAQPNPAFVPWHSMALALYHAETGDTAAAAFVFEMNDWLLGMQQGDEAPADVQGEFFDPARPEFGPPHASATGVYLEGLVEAFALARALGDRDRESRYRRAILRGLRSLRQLQFRHASDMGYITRRSAVLGGLRSSAFDNTLRIDNVQHGLMAIFRILDLFSDADYRM
ncbi:hypothetical protein GCM10007291_08880 [Gemmobacter nanjingensis]|uniref:Uncharacterized protein n=1 Tax=Gemmobacter nanjingensis TaxID=488454 RepID=A0ABQ3F8K3_9RHOB|nr:hypothetical protein [Gemmobacter nanjingensis]GHC13498.1 hypothetical protein GCM10007291_08880 [Gemmobacter nanjingensis]